MIIGFLFLLLQANNPDEIIHNLNPAVVDCEEDTECFTEHLLFCEKAKVKLLDGWSPSSFSNLDSHFWLYFASDSSVAEVKEYTTIAGYYFCFVEITDLKYKDEVWETGRCRFNTNSPSSETRSRTEPQLVGCSELR